MSSYNLKLPAINNRQTPSESQNHGLQDPSQRELSKSTSLAIVRAKRKQVEESAHLLNNRVMVLEHEQDKLVKVTRDTKEKTSSMLKHRVEREETQRNIREMTKKMKELAHQTYVEKRQKVQDMQRQNHEERDYMKNQQIGMLRDQKEMNLRKLQEIKERTLAENRLKREKVKHMKRVAEQNVGDFFNRRLDHFARERELMIIEEERLIQDKEDLIKNLSRKEDKLLNDVDEQQVRVRKAQNEFEDLNHLETDDFVNRHTEYLQVITPNRNLNKSVLSTKSITTTNRNNKSLKLGKTTPPNQILESKIEHDDLKLDHDEPKALKKEDPKIELKSTPEQSNPQQNKKPESEVDEGKKPTELKVEPTQSDPNKNEPSKNEVVGTLQPNKDTHIKNQDQLDISNDKSIL